MLYGVNSKMCIVVMRDEIMVGDVKVRMVGKTFCISRIKIRT